MTDETTLVVRSTLMVPTMPTREDQECYNYGKKEHIIYNYPQSRNTGGSRGGRGKKGGRGG
jgi:hypothetical protein